MAFLVFIYDDAVVVPADSVAKEVGRGFGLDGFASTYRGLEELFKV